MKNTDFSKIKVGDKLQVSPDFLRAQVKKETEDNRTFEVVRARSDGYYIDNGKMIIKITPQDRWWVRKN